MRIIVALALALTLASCSLAVSVIAGDKIEEGMASLVGQPIEAAIAKLGVPNDQQVIAGHTVYPQLAPPCSRSVARGRMSGGYSPAILGHEEKTVADGYGVGHPVPMLKLWIDKIGF